ncbi:MAG: DUF445 family protein [Gemmatimonadota bacterium]|nr:DUF445 family protein [Gemmatimonadota bacterium]MDE3216222.1 DUF445 family protein [Gemmatimonadota bacterium]
MIATDNPWVEFLVHVAIGTVAGGASDTVAVWMLFHPRRKILGFQGAIPKNQARLARSLGRTVGERLLTPHDIMAELTRAGVREKLDETLALVIGNVLDTERPSLREALPPSVLLEVERALMAGVPLVVERAAEFADSPEFEARTRAFVARRRAELRDRPVGAVLTPDRRAAITERAARWAEEFAQSDELSAGVHDYVARRAAAMLGSREPLLRQVPPAFVSAVDGGIEAYLPIAVNRLAGVLRDPGARERIRLRLHALFSRFVEDLKFHERVIAKLVVTERTLDRALDSVEKEGAEQLGELLEDPAVRERISAAVHDAITAYLAKPLAEIVGPADSERARAVVDSVSAGLVRVLRAGETRGLLVEKLDQALQRAEQQTWGELLAPLDDETLTGWIVQAARSPRSRELVEDTARSAIGRLLDRPIGRPGRWLPPDSATRLGGAFAPAIWGLVEAQLPGLIQRLDVQAMVERKVLAFSFDRLEELIRGVINRELRLIILIGYVLGGAIAVVGFSLSRLFGM